MASSPRCSGVLEQVLLLDHLDARPAPRRRPSGCRRSCSRREIFSKRLLERLAHGHAGDREAVAEALADRHHVGHDAPVLHAQPLARAAPAGEHLVGHQQDLLLVAELAQLGEEVVRRHDRAAPALDRLEHEAGHVADRALVDVLVVERDVLVGVDRAVGLGPHAAGRGRAAAPCACPGARTRAVDRASGSAPATRRRRSCRGNRRSRRASRCLPGGRAAARACPPRPPPCRSRRTGSRSGRRAGPRPASPPARVLIGVVKSWAVHQLPAYFATASLTFGWQWPSVVT